MMNKFDPLPETPRCALGESPIWDERESALYWVDIVGKRVLRHHFATAQTAQWETDDFPTAIALAARRGEAVLATAKGVAHFDLANGRITARCRPDNLEGNRLNDGRCDPQGRFWVGSMQNNLHPDGSDLEMDRNSGALFRIDADYSTSQHTEREFGISNTMAWSPDGRIFYFGDSVRNVIFAYEFDPDEGVIGKRRVLLEGHARGVPDGSAIDAEGCLWNARFGGGIILRITPDGKVEREIPLPVTNPTSCTFAGPGRRQLVVTSAIHNLSASHLAANPLEGAVLVTDVAVEGLPDYHFAEVS